MFQPSVPAFLDCARDLYTRRAFDVPPPPVAAPAVPAEWRSYDGPTATTSVEWQQFRASSEFLQVHAQWMDRIQDCERFALRYCSGKEATDILDALKILRERLMKGYGEDYATSRITVLFGEGKRAMDRICLRLAQDALPLEFRRRHLREMAYQLHHCLSTGPAYVQAAAALDMPPDGLRSAFLTLVRQRSDDVLRRAYLEDHRNDPDFYLRSMEVHGVNRMRMEYRLPGANPLDAASFGSSLFDPGGHPRHLHHLREALAPCRLADALAAQYWEQLLERLPPAVPGRASGDDLNEVMPLIQAAVTAVNTSLAPVSMTSLLETDEASDTFRWRRGNALVTRELLLALEREDWVVTRPRAVMHRGTEDGIDWQLEAIDDELFYVLESNPLLPSPVTVPVGLRHLKAIEAASGPRVPSTAARTSPLLPAAWLDVVLHDTPTHQLADIPAHWLSRSQHLDAWLQRVEPDAFVRWIRTSGDVAVHSPEAIVRTLTSQGRTDLLEALMRSGRAPIRAWLRWAGPDILSLAVAAPSVSTFDLWRQQVLKALPTARPATVSDWFTPVPDRSLLACAIETRDADRVASVLALIETSLTAGALPSHQLLRHLICPMQMLLHDGRQDVLPLLGDFLVKACRQGWLTAADLHTYLGGRCPGWGCEGALTGGQDLTLRWYLDLIQQLQASGGLPRSGLASLVAEPSPEGHVVSHAAVLNNRSTTLGAFLGALIDHAQEGRIPVPLLQRQLTCDGPERSGVYTLVAALPDAACLHVWRHSVHKAWRLNLLSCADVRDLVGGPRVSRRPLLRTLLQDDAQQPTERWLAAVQWLFEREALTTVEVVALLRAEVPRVDLPARPLFHQMMLSRRGMHHTTRYGFIVSSARAAGMISDTELEDLLRADSPDRRTPALIDAVERGERGVIDTFVQTLIGMTQAGDLPSAALLRLMDGRSPEGRSALATAARRQDVGTLRLLLDHGLDALRAEVLSAAQWFSLLAPDDHTDSLMVAVRTQRDATLTYQVLETLSSAEALGMLTADQALLAASLLGVRPSPPLAP